MSKGTTTQVAHELGLLLASVPAARQAQWQHWLGVVERSIENRFRRAGLDLDEQIQLGTPTQGDVADVEVAAVARKARNPSGSTSKTVTVDDGTLTTRREGLPDVDPLELTDAEWGKLFPDAPEESTAFSTRPGFQPDCQRFWP